jgi:hypothetical protein
MPKREPDEQYTPRGHKIPVPERAEFQRNLDKLITAEQPTPRMRKPRTKPPQFTP